jgi:TIGR03009 family protein
MRSILALLCTTGAMALAQPPAVPPAAGDSIDDVLNGWEKTMGVVKAMSVDIVRTRLDKTFDSTEVFEGWAKFLRSSLAGQPSRASLELKKKGKPEVFERFIYTGTFLYEFRPATKVIAVHELPAPGPGAVADDNIVSFIFGTKADELKKRYAIERTRPSDMYYHYVKITPRFPADKAEFSIAELVLVRTTLLPCRFWFRQPNGDEMTWDFKNVDTAAVVPIIQFAAPVPDPGWKLERQKELAPRVMRK